MGLTEWNFWVLRGGGGGGGIARSPRPLWLRAWVCMKHCKNRGGSSRGPAISLRFFVFLSPTYKYISFGEVHNATKCWFALVTKSYTNVVHKVGVRPVATGGSGGLSPPWKNLSPPPLGCLPWPFIGIGIEVYSPPGILSAPPTNDTWLRRWWECVLCLWSHSFRCIMLGFSSITD